MGTFILFYNMRMFRYAVNFLLVLVSLLSLSTTTSNAAAVPKLIGGANASHIIPYQVSIQIGILNSYTHQCGGALISPSWIVTAAHCVTLLTYILSRVVAGFINSSDIETAQIRNIDWTNVILHPDYNGPPLNDIALIKMKEPFDIDDRVRPIQISKVDCISKEVASFSGWGILYLLNGTGGRPAEMLQVANLTVLEYENCRKLLQPLYGDNLSFSNEKNICSANDEHVGPCILDDGSPLVQDDRLIGTLSLLPGPCGAEGVPSIFTNVGYYKDFIEAHVDDLS